MPVKLKTPLSEFDMAIDELTDHAENAVLNTLMYVGESCIIEARDNGNYTDQTGNLRSSIGYVVVKDGEIVRKNVVKEIQNGRAATTQGNSTADSYLKRLASDHPKGICLIVVAGMNYAVYVEGRGKNVLSSSELLAERIVPQMLEQLGFIVRKK
jgi:hypothetical protein